MIPKNDPRQVLYAPDGTAYFVNNRSAVGLTVGEQFVGHKLLSFFDAAGEERFFIASPEFLEKLSATLPD